MLWLSARLHVVDERSVLQSDQVDVGLDAFVRYDALRLHRQLQLDAVARLPFARHHGIAFAISGVMLLAVDSKPLYAADLRRLRVELARGPVRDAHVHRKRLGLFRIDRD